MKIIVYNLCFKFSTTKKNSCSANNATCIFTRHFLNKTFFFLEAKRGKGQPLKNFLNKITN